ncbi:MAG: thiamine diphosphokinase [Atribacterota bacterium]|nr:thiamine diphosphokinase [Atribacterota bacterium]
MDSLIKTIIIIGNGNDWDAKKFVSYCQQADYIIAADNGLSLLDRFQFIPDLIVGDLDSAPKALLDKYKHIPAEKHPVKKDFSDSELSIKKAISIQPEEIILLAMTGNYFDHSYANILNLFRNYQKGILMKIITSNSMIFPIVEKTILYNLKGRRFSLFPIESIRNISLKGSLYQFMKKDLQITDYSISNVIVDKKLEIEFDKGKLFCVLFDDGFQ